MNRISRQLISIAKSLIAEVEVDPYQHSLLELNQWIKGQFSQQARSILDKLHYPGDLREIKQEKIVRNSTYFGVWFTNDGKKDIEFNKIFVVPYKWKFIENSKQPIEIKERNLVATLSNLKNKGTGLYCKLTLPAKDWYPLFRSCKKEVTYNDDGRFDTKSFQKITESLNQCLDELEI